MARALIVGCGCRGRALAAELMAAGHEVRGTTRRSEGLAEIEATGAEAVLANPDRLATVVPQLERVSLLCWLMGMATGPPEAVAALHGPRLESLLAAIVDTPVRGVVYEAAGSVRAELLARGADIARRAAAAHRIPVELIERPPSEHASWLEAAVLAATRPLADPA